MCANIVEILQAIVTNGLSPPKLFRQEGTGVTAAAHGSRT
jgi:hypothetical protein